MAKKKPDLSNWIQYLISQRSRYSKLTATCLSLALGLFSATMAIMVTLGTKAPLLNLTYIVFFSEIFFLGYVGLRANSWSNTVSELLKAILKEKKTDVKEIRDEWFKWFEGGKMASKKEKEFEKLKYLMLGLIIGGAMSFFGSLTASAFFSGVGEVSWSFRLLFLSAFVTLFVLAYVLFLSFHKKSK